MCTPSLPHKKISHLCKEFNSHLQKHIEYATAVLEFQLSS